MNDKKIVMPEGMMNAAHAVFAKDVSVRSGGISYSLKPVLEAAAQWLEVELQKMIKDDPYSKDTFMRSESYIDTSNRNAHNNAIRKVIRMFVAPDPMALTITVPKAGTYHVHENGSITAYVKCEESKEAQVWCAPVEDGNIPAGEVDASIPDILFNYPTSVSVNVANEKIRKAYRRGRNEVQK